MSGLDRKGPRGEGAMTGRGRGRCTTDDDKPRSIFGIGGAFRRGRAGMARGCRRMRCRIFSDDSGESRP